MKAYTYLGTALLNLNRPAESFTASQKAYNLAIDQRSPSVSTIAASCLQAKKAKWELSEVARVRTECVLLKETCELVLQDARNHTTWFGGNAAAAEEALAEAERKCRALEEVFGKAEAERLGRREVPDWLVDNITFGIMWDPVIVGFSRQRKGWTCVLTLSTDEAWALVRPRDPDRPPEAQRNGSTDTGPADRGGPAPKPCAPGGERAVFERERVGRGLVVRAGLQLPPTARLIFPRAGQSYDSPSPFCFPLQFLQSIACVCGLICNFAFILFLGSGLLCGARVGQPAWRIC